MDVGGVVSFVLWRENRPWLRAEVRLRSQLGVGKRESHVRDHARPAVAGARCRLPCPARLAGRLRDSRLISYYDGTGDNLKIAHCANVACTSGTTQPVDEPGDVGIDTSVTVGVDGVGLITYFDVTNFDLKIAHCANALCVSYLRRR
jgi:hypothetical protein